MNNRKEDMEIASHYRQLLRELNEQRQHGILCDACVVVEGKIFKAHKNVLLGSSRYFKTLYCQVKKGTEQQATITHLDIVTAQGFKTILDFMYSAHLALTSKNVIEVMSAASYLQMTEIVQACHGFIRAALDISIRSELADMELANIEISGMVGTGTGTAGGASEALVSMISARSSSPWLVRRTSPANSSGDSAIASCHESSSTYSKDEHEPKSHEDSWPNDYRSHQVKEEQGSPSNAQHRTSQESHGTPSEQSNGGEGWQTQTPGSRRRKNRKNKDTVRHIMQQHEGSSSGGSPMPSMISTASWSYNTQADIPGADEAEPSTDTRDQRIDFFMKQEESGEPGFHGSSLANDRAEVVGGSQEQGGSVASLRAALMSKNSLLSLGTEMFSEENTLLFDYLPKGGHTLSRSHCSSGGHCKRRASSFSSPPTLARLLPLWPPGAFSLPLAWGSSENQDVEQDTRPSPSEEEVQEEEDNLSNTAGSSQAPIVVDQMAKEKHGVCVAQELACSLCKQLFSSLLQLRQHEYRHTFSLMQLSMDYFEPRPPSSGRYLCSRCPASFTLKSNADRHEKTIHFKCKLLQCTNCLKHFRDRTDLNRHLASVHSGERGYECPSCSCSFATQKNLVTHIRLCLVDAPSSKPHSSPYNND
ncbi:zinc finger and BTB domain-containing protein 46 isoform X1 [Tachysurus fulvidraco]|uniref:zinc finger and BTB domain-containing protein 46 isoform X1 n=1 Tax=Tachysurus fulvidraco TaxID=1234273 RepID=UPI000F50F8E6|nr:zinc finger and BTB domain-containing protein 46 isoform X1 [Tachysurus fulvidraco]XP_027001088.1 zinc finger and BTB domain-containing protein 46 isoform X1 [Tachysurus fulvidraco]XP_027001089.1 zinc finger and BTB domain-containing protein 46 isoform X1 [Tachysurus fulvidraco]